MRCQRGDGRGVGPAAGEAGVSLVELLMVGACLVLVAGMSAPAVARAVDAARARHAAGVIASWIREGRHQAVARTRAAGVVFDQTEDGRWSLRSCQDGNANGLRRRDVDAGIDTCRRALTVDDAFPGVSLALPDGVRGPDGRTAGTDPVRFGRGDMASCSPAGTCSPGTCFVLSRGGALYAVRLAGATGRLRILRYDEGSAAWVSG